MIKLSASTGGQNIGREGTSVGSASSSIFKSFLKTICRISLSVCCRSHGSCFLRSALNPELQPSSFLWRARICFWPGPKSDFGMNSSFFLISLAFVWGSRIRRERTPTPGERWLNAHSFPNPCRKSTTLLRRYNFNVKICNMKNKLDFYWHHQIPLTWGSTVCRLLSVLTCGGRTVVEKNKLVAKERKNRKEHTHCL